MNHTLAGPHLDWQRELERRAAAAAEKERIRRIVIEDLVGLNSVPSPPLSRPQLLGMALACGLIGAFAALALAMSLHVLD